MTLDACDGETCGGARRDCTGETSRNSHTTHSYARHLLMIGIPINYLSRWLGHSSIQTTLIYRSLCRTRRGVSQKCRKLYRCIMVLCSRISENH